ncbi:MAG: LuxR C-terminal-related transcriptional regulator [Thermomicrobiales bacterium]
MQTATQAEYAESVVAWPAARDEGAVMRLRRGVARPRLVERIDRGARGKLTLLAAPAGWGKTTALAEWMARAEMPVAWVALEAPDHVPLRFWRRVVAALDRLQPGVAEDALALLRMQQSPPMEQVVDAALDAAAALRYDAALVLEDLHIAQATETYQALERFLDRLPPALHVVIASRVDPPLRLSRLRAQGDLVEIRAGDLAFDREEAGRFFAEMPGVGIGDDAVAALVERTEGWVAGLRLAALSLEGRADADSFVAGFGGTHRDVADYLGEEVLSRQPAEVVDFLRDTAVLERMTASLCDAVTGRGDGHEMIDRLERANLFLMPLDDRREWFRYHGLFADLLRARPRRDHPDHEHELHRRAATWYDEHGAPVDGARHAMQGGDAGQAAAILERAADRLLWTDGEVAVFLQMLDTLPAEAWQARPRLMRSRVWALVMSGRLAEADAAVAAIERALETGTPADNDAAPPIPSDPDGLGVLRGEAAAIRGRIAACRSDHEAAARYARETLALVPGDHGRLRSDVALNLGYACMVLGQRAEAVAAFEEAIAAGRASGNTRATLFGVYYLAQMRGVYGRLHEARLLLEEELERVERGPAAGAPVAILRIGLAEALYEQNEIAAARRYLEQAVAEGRRSGDAKTLIYAYLLLARVYQAMGEPAAAAATMRRGVTLIGGPWAGPEEARLALMQGDIVATERLLSDAGMTIADEPASGDEGHYATLARVLIARGRLDEAVALIERRLAAAEAGGRAHRVMALKALLALARYERGEREAACELIGRAVALAAPDGYVRTFVDLGAPMAALLREALRASRRSNGGASPLPVEAARSLLAAFGESGNGHDAAGRASGLVEPLTERERQILGLLATGRSNQEIADELYVALGTVKAHLNHIYGKLLARNRAEAIVTARRLGILPS